MASRKVILPKRKFSSAERYRFIWTEEGPPLVVNMCRLAEKIQRMFEDDEDAGSIVVRSAMSYGSPSLPHMLSGLREEGVNRIVLLPLYPQSAHSLTMAVVDSFWRAQDAVGWHPDSTIIDNYHDNEGYIAVITRSIHSVGYDAAAGDRLILSFHAIPLADGAAGDTYRARIAASVSCIAARLGADPAVITVSFQSVFGPNPLRWTAPLTLDVLKGCRDGSFRVVLARPGFPSIVCKRSTTFRTIWCPRSKGEPQSQLPCMPAETSSLLAIRAGGSSGCQP